MHLPADILNRPFATLVPGKVADILASDLEAGLTDEEAAARRARFGANLIERARGSSWLSIILSQLKSPLILMLMAAALVTVAIGDYQDALFILAAVSVNALLGYYQEHKAEKALRELKTYLRQRARVLRTGKERDIDATELVPGDLIRLAQGDRVPADARLVFVNDLEIDEAVLTGEPFPAEKSTEAAAPEAPIGDQHGMAFAGTMVTQGVATALVVGTGMQTELGRIALLVGSSENEETPLQALIRKFSMRATIALTAFTVALFVVGVLAGEAVGTMFVTAVAVAVSAVPEGLPIAMTVILAIGVQRMARRHAVVRKLAAAEALGSTDVILTDKTGTLTSARMEIAELIPADGTSEDALLAYALENASVVIENPEDPADQWRIDGRIIEVSLVRSAALRGAAMADLARTEMRAETLPFNAVNKFSASVVGTGARRTLILVGAPDILIARTALSADARAAFLTRIEEKAGAGALVLGVATRSLAHARAFDIGDVESMTELSFAGLITLRDPIRPNVPAAIRSVEEAGIRVVLVTGDHRGTAEAIAREAGLRVTQGSVLDAGELRALSDAELAERLPGLAIVARVSPLDKMRIAKAFQARGLVVAMTGDGVNDAPSIKQADVGIAMGSGTAVARNVADLVLLDDNFETIAAAVEEGRQIMGNIRKVLVYLLSDTADNLFLIGGALLMGLALPLNALQILWVNFFSDSFPAVAFAFERERDHTARRHARVALFDPLMSFLILFIGTLTSAFLFFLYWYLLEVGYQEALVRTFVFASFASYTLLSAFALRSLTRSVFTYSPFGNPAMLAGVGIGLVLIAIALYVPVVGALLDTVPLPLSWLGGVLAVALLNILAIELAKWLFRTFGHRVGVRRALP